MVNILKNLMGSSDAGTWNVLPAVLTTWSNLLSSSGNQTQYDLYKQQAQSYIDAARQNADLIKRKGAVALRNLQYKDKLERGMDVAKVGATGGNLSGSNLDVIMQKEKIRKINEATLSADFANQIMLEMRKGYNQAASTYGALSAKATADKYGVWASLLKGLEVYAGLSTRDYKEVHRSNELERYLNGTLDAKSKAVESRYTRNTQQPAVPITSDAAMLFPDEGKSLINSEGVTDSTYIGVEDIFA